MIVIVVINIPKLLHSSGAQILSHSILCYCAEY